MAAGNVNISYEQEVTENKRLRKEIDEKIQQVKQLPPSRERSLVTAKLQEAVMWLGMDLKRLGEKNPSRQAKTRKREQLLNQRLTD